MGDWEWFSNGNGNVFHHWTIIVFQIRKPWIHVPVKDVALEESDHFLSRVYLYRFLQTRIQIVDEDRQTCDVVHVRMRDDDVFDFGALLVGQRNGDATGVDGDAVVYQKTSQTLLQGCHASSVKGAG